MVIGNYTKKVETIPIKSKLYWHTYNKKRQDYLLKKQKEYRSKQKLLKLPKPRSPFLQNREKNFIRCLLN